MESKVGHSKHVSEDFVKLTKHLKNLIECAQSLMTSLEKLGKDNSELRQKLEQQETELQSFRTYSQIYRKRPQGTPPPTNFLKSMFHLW